MILDPNVILSDAALLLKERQRRDSKMSYFAVPPVPLGTKSQAAVAHTHVHTRTWTRLATTHRKQLLTVTCVVLTAEPACERGSCRTLSYDLSMPAVLQAPNCAHSNVTLKELGTLQTNRPEFESQHHLVCVVPSVT